jgi:hypothetical protein
LYKNKDVLMFIVSSSKYVTGVLQDPKDFKSYINAVPDHLLHNLTFDAYPLKYPFYIIEDCYKTYEKFSYWPMKEAAEAHIKKELLDASNKKYTKFINYYEITEDFWIKGKEGDDQMGLMDHTHYAICGNCGKQGPGLPLLVDLETCNCEDSQI